ncbi:MAG: Hsp20/alpha crystallin family protein [Pseudomonadota bacterium]
MKKISLIFGALLMASVMQPAAAWWSDGPSSYAFQQWYSGPGYTTGVHVQRFTTYDGYHIRISSGDGAIDNINIHVDGRSINISSQQFQEQQQQDYYGNKRRRHSGSFRQWVTLPGDADMQSMQRRRVNPDVIEIFVPRFR